MVATILQAVGIAIVSLGLGLIYPPIGVIGVGVGAFVFGLAIERGNK